MDLTTFLCLFYTIIVLVHGNDNRNTNVNCQLDTSERKQMNVEPLNETCLHDIVVQLSNVFLSIANEELGIPTFLEVLDNLEFSNITNNLENTLNMLVQKLNNKLLSHVDLLQKSNRIIELILLKKRMYSIYSDKRNNIKSTQNEALDICSEITTELTAKLKDQGWKNLHVLPLYPPGRICGPPSLVHNIGPLLLSQHCSAKNIILLLEHGTFISEEELILIQITAKTVIDMLSEKDYVTAIGLAGNGFVYCKDGLVKATDINKYQLGRHIDSLTKKGTNQTINIDLKVLTQNLQGEVILLHLTNTLQDPSNAYEIFNKISAMQLNAYWRTILVLSDHGKYISIKDTLKNDSIITLPTQNVLGFEISRLFSGIKCSHNEIKEYYLSDPYFEPYSKMMSTSIGLITNVTLLYLDVTLKDFLDDLTYLNIGSEAYGILFDSKEVVWIHKDFPRMEMITEQPIKVYLQDIENISSEVAAIMIEKNEGLIDVQINESKKKIYMWKHLTYKDLILCLVSVNEDVTMSIIKNIPTLPTNLLYHSLDLISHGTINKDVLCVHQNNIIALSSGVVYLSPWCFQSPMEQLKLLETNSGVIVQSYMAYIKDLTGLLANPGLHHSVRPDVVTLSKALEHFKERHIESSINEFVIRRYIIGTTSGALEVFPGIIIDSGLDPKRRIWYGKALKYPGKIVFTGPYLDAGGSGYVVTLSHSIQHSKYGQNNDNAVMAVMSMDVTMGYISRLLIEMFPFCKDSTIKCFLMDDMGYLVSHPSLLQPMSKVEQQHLTHKEQLIANDILNQEYFVKKKTCASYLDGTVQRYYHFNTSLQEVLTNTVHGEHCIKYQIAAIPNTNIFLGVVNVTCNSLRAFCPCSTTDRLCLNCRRMEQTECECPCECSLYSSSCVQHKINLEACPPPSEQTIHLSHSWSHHLNIKSCPSFDCKVYKTEGECLGIVGCQWCYMDIDGVTSLQIPFCSDVFACFKGIFGAPVPYNDETHDSQSIEEIVVREFSSVGPVAGGILVFILILGITLCCYRLHSMQSDLEHQCLHVQISPDVLHMTHLEGDVEPLEPDQTKHNLDSFIRDAIAPISPYRVSTNYKRPGGDSDHGYSTMTPHDDSEQQIFTEPMLIVGSNVELNNTKRSNSLPAPTTNLGSTHYILAPVTVHSNMETNCC
ncbi:VWFA and cache domain-containing protein 1 [Vespa crabro]|uniref:VWFA and cache domain-containing protein 1 n=1 Tax=Vespa crabro TaxID=7445 RepID=UPI001F031DA6|nr:VWFA and cache domain-containing protein 1 [Vespa crabro]